jgi:Na+-driven multidrug efflux pump
MGQVSHLALGAVGLGSTTFITISLILRGAVSGTMSFVSQMYGAGDLHGVGRYLKFFLLLTLLIFSASLGLPRIFLAFFSLTKPDSVVATCALEYLNIRELVILNSLCSWPG